MTRSKTVDLEISEIVEANRGRLLSVISKTLRDQVEAEDVLQDVIEEFVETYELSNVLESVSAWLMRVAQNKVLDRFRRRKVQDRYVTQVRMENVDLEEPSSFNQPDEQFERAWLHAEIVEALDALPDEQREVYVLHELEGKSFDEIAQETGIGVNTLLSRKRYATLFLREYLKEVYDELK